MGDAAHKPIVFVFGTQKGDAAGRKRNLSAINTQVAYRAHERRRENKNRQRALAKENSKVTVDGSATLLTKLNHVQSAKHESSDPFLANRTTPLIWTEDASFVRHQPLSTKYISVDENASNTHASLTASVISSGELLQLKPSQTRNDLDQLSTNGSDSDIASAEVWSISSNCERVSSPITDASSASPSTLPNNYLNGTLDPFFRLPKVVTERERWLIHFYFREMGHVGFGTRADAIFCPDRDWISSYVSSKPMCLQWVLIHAENHLARIGTYSDQTGNIERKSSVYRALNQTLRTTDAEFDDSISGIMFSAILDVPNTTMHLQALDRQLAVTGGFEAFLRRPLGLVNPEHIASVYAFGRCPVNSLSELEMTMGRFFKLIRLFHITAKREQAESKRLRNRRPWDNPGRQVIDGNGTLVPISEDEHFRYYLSTRQECFSSDTVGTIVNTPLNTKDWYPNQARHIAVLVQLHLILHEFRDSHLARATFLKRLRYVAEMSTARDPITGQTRLSAAALLLFNSFVRQEVQNYIDKTKVLSRGINISIALVDALKLVPLLSDISRAQVVSWLREWLCQNNDRIDGYEMSHVEEDSIAGLMAEIRQSWISSNSRRKQHTN